MLERFGQKWISRIFQFYTTDRLMHFVGSNVKWEVYKFETAEFRAELLTLALAQVKELMRRKREKLSDAGEPVPIELADREHLKESEILAAIKGGWRDLAFHVEPYSSLSTTRQARAQMLAQMQQAGNVPGYMVLEELGYANAKELYREAAEEMRERAAMGLPVGGPPQQGKKPKQQAGQKR